MDAKRRKIEKEDARAVRMNPAYDNDKTKALLSKALHEGAAFDDDGVTGAFATADPFPCCRLPNFVDDSDGFLSDVLAELEASRLSMSRKSNDLYDFDQTIDLKNCRAGDLPLVCRLRDMLYTELLRWMRDVTGIDLNDTVNMTCARYGIADNLLCHDDELEGRRIAYILYLVPKDWSAAKGGCLDLFSVDAHGQPDAVVQSLVPQWNQLAFFEVSPVSYHQVAECLCDDGRISISGWFYGPPIQRPSPFVEPPVPVYPALAVPPTDGAHSLSSWVSANYLEARTRRRINELFVDESCSFLADFLVPERYASAVSEARALGSGGWAVRGPANRRHYDTCVALKAIADAPDYAEAARAAEDAATTHRVPTLASLALMLRSEEFRSFISELTGLELKSSCLEGRRFGRACYTLLYDDDTPHSMANTTALDAVLYLASPSDAAWSTSFGGHTVYVAQGEDEELLSVVPRQNALSLVFKDEGTMSFVKYVNCHAPLPVHDLCMRFAEAP